MIRFSIDLLGIPGAEKIVHEGEEGIFLPADTCLNVRRPDKKRFLKKGNLYYLSGLLFPSLGRRNYDYAGMVILPQKGLDIAMENPEIGARKRWVRTIIYAWEVKKKPVADKDDFKELTK